MKNGKSSTTRLKPRKQQLTAVRKQQKPSRRTPPTEQEWDSITIQILCGVSSLHFLSALLINDADAADVPTIGGLVEMVGDRIEELLELKGTTFVERLWDRGAQEGTPA